VEAREPQCCPNNLGLLLHAVTKAQAKNGESV